MSLECSTCQSQDVQKLSVIYEGGVSQISTTTRTSGLGIAGGGGLGFGAASSKTSGTQVSALAQKAAPPKKKPAVATAIFAFICLLLCGWSMVFLLGVIGLGYLSYTFFKFNGEDFPTLLRRWQASFMCQRCGEIFQWDRLTNG